MARGDGLAQRMAARVNESVILAVLTITVPSIVASIAGVLVVRTRRGGAEDESSGAAVISESVNWYRDAWLACRSALRRLVSRDMATGVEVSAETVAALDLTPPDWSGKP